MEKIALTITALIFLLIDLYCTTEMLLEKDYNKSRKYFFSGVFCSIVVIGMCLYVRFWL